MTILKTILPQKKHSEKFDPQLLKQLDPQKVPRHIAIVMDGNRRWAKKHKLATILGHHSGVDVLMECVEAAENLSVKTLTAYTFSTENWLRPKSEVSALLELFENSLKKHLQKMLDNGVRLHHIGEISRFPHSFQEVLKTTEEATSTCQKIDLVLALNYGARDEICRAVNKILHNNKRNNLPSEEITEEMISSHLDTASWPDPELYIRTSGEHRLSNFLLWQISYGEVYFTNTLWPDFTPQELLSAILDYQKRERRLGK